MLIGNFWSVAAWPSTDGPADGCDGAPPPSPDDGGVGLGEGCGDGFSARCGARPLSPTTAA